MIRHEARRRGITPSIRAQVFHQHGERCHYCGFSEPSTLEIDHVIPWSQGGADDPENYVPACWRCNLEKGAQTPEQWAAARTSQGKPWPIPHPHEAVSRIAGHLDADTLERFPECPYTAEVHTVLMSGREAGFDPQAAADRLATLLRGGGSVV